MAGPRAKRTQTATSAAAWRTVWPEASASGSEPSRFCEPWSRDHHGVVESELLRGEEERRAQALDLERPPELALHGVDEALRRDQRERHDDHREGCRERAERDPRLPPAVPPRDVDEQRRQEHERVDLRRDGDPQHGEAEALPPGEDGGERRRRQQGRPEVVAGQHHGAEREREQPDRDGGREQPAWGCLERRGRPDDEHEQRGRAEPHEHLEERAVVLGRPERRQPEHRQRARRVLEREVPVGHLAGRHRLAVLLVHRRVDDLVAVEGWQVQRPPGRGQEAEADGQREQDEASVSGWGRALRPGAHRPNPRRAAPAPPPGPPPARASRTRRRGRTRGCRGRTSVSARARSRSAARR